MLIDFFCTGCACGAHNTMICKIRIACYSHGMGLKSSMLKGKLCGATDQGSML